MQTYIKKLQKNYLSVGSVSVQHQSAPSQGVDDVDAHHGLSSGVLGVDAALLHDVLHPVQDQVVQDLVDGVGHSGGAGSSAESPQSRLADLGLEGSSCDVTESFCSCLTKSFSCFSAS